MVFVSVKLKILSRQFDVQILRLFFKKAKTPVIHDLNWSNSIKSVHQLTSELSFGGQLSNPQGKLAHNYLLQRFCLIGQINQLAQLNLRKAWCYLVRRNSAKLSKLSLWLIADWSKNNSLLLPLWAVWPGLALLSSTAFSTS